MRLPNFLIIGAQKSGTSWLHSFLASRPDVFVPTQRKELWFFDHEDRFLSLGVPGYAAFFEGAGAAVAVGEATPGYLFVDDPHPAGGRVNEFRRGVPGRVREILGRDLKLIASLRNPIDRALSAFLHHRKRGRIPTGSTIGDCWGRGAIVNIGFYGAQLARWADVFPHRNFLLITYEDLFASADKRSAVLAFIGAAPASGDEMLNHQVNAGLGFKRNANGAFDATGALIASADEISALREVFSGDVQRLADDWGLDLGAWSNDFRLKSRDPRVATR